MKKELFVLRLLAAVLLLLVVALVISLAVITNKSDGSSRGQCSGQPHTDRDLDNPEIFDDLSYNELMAVRDYLNKELKLLAFDKVQATRNLKTGYIYAIDLHLPNKLDALSYLNDGGDRPKREALVTVIRGDTEPPCIQEYVVGPIPSPTYHRLFKNPSYRVDPIPHHTKFVDLAEYSALYEIVSDVSKTLYKVLKESFGAGHHNCTKEEPCLTFSEFAPRLFDSGQRTTLFAFFIKSEGYYIRPTCFMMTINHKSVDTSDWTVVNLYYNKQTFFSAQALLEAYENNNITKVKIPDQDDTYYWSYKKHGGYDMPETPKMGPRLYEPDGNRYKVTGRHVEYMGWTFNFRSKFSTGLQLLNVKFRGERIAYEISAQEAFVIYAGNDLLQTVANYYDASWNMGESAFELMPGVDCPLTASYYDMDYFVNANVPKRNRRSVCIFELNNGMPLRRHFTPDYQGGFEYYAGVPDYQLVIRQITTVWNYDYVFDYVFHLNGAIEVKAAATGYPQTSWYYPEEDSYGHKLSSHVVANMHIHTFHYKVDVDILGITNRYETIDIGVETVENLWNAGNKTQMKLDRVLKRTEKEAAYKYDFNQPKICLFYNNDQKNGHGTRRGFRLMPLGIAKFVLPHQSVPGTAAAKWTKYQMAVTKYKDGEQTSSTVYSQNDPFDPVLDFEDFINDNEGIVDEDVVAWVSLATHHVPHSEDAPSTQTPHNTLSFFLYPYNYFDEDPSTSSSDTVWVKPEDKSFAKIHLERFGTPTSPVCRPADDQFSYNGTTFTG